MPWTVSGSQLIWSGPGPAPYLSPELQRQLRASGGGETPAGAITGVYSPSPGAPPIPLPGAVSAAAASSGGGEGGSFEVKPDFSVIGQFLPGLSAIQKKILAAKVPKREQHFRNTVLGQLTALLTGQGGAPGTLFSLPGQYTSEIDTFVGGQVDTQMRALATQYANAQQDIIQNAAVQGFNPAGALGMLSTNYAKAQADIQSGASTLRFNSAEAQRNRIAQSILPTSASTSEFGIDIPNRQIAALSGAFGSIAGGASSLQNAAFTPAQIQAQLIAAQMASDVQAQIAAQEQANRLAIAQISGQFGVDAARAGQTPGLNPFSAILGQLGGSAAGAIGNRIGEGAVNRLPDLWSSLRTNAGSWWNA